MTNTATQQPHSLRRPQLVLRRSFNSNEYQADPQLVCTSIRYRIGAEAASAQFQYLPEDSEAGRAFFNVEKHLDHCGWDDRVMVLQPPYQADQAVLEDPQQWTVLFEGIMDRREIEIQGNQVSDSEHLRFQATSLASVNNEIMTAQLAGRVVHDPADASKAFYLNSATLPAIFNRQGKANRSAQADVNFTVPHKGNSLRKAYVFTADDHHDAGLWKYFEAINLLLCAFLFRSTRHLSVSTEVWDMLDYEDDLDLPEYEGMTDLMPETSVQGMGVLQALETVCNQAGYVLAINCVGTPKEIASPSMNSGLDRHWRLDIYRKGYGPRQSFALDPRGTTYTDSSLAAQRNTLAALKGYVDLRQSVNRLKVISSQYAETWFPLKPLWNISDFDDSAIQGHWQQPNKEHGDLKDGKWASKYVQGGDRYAAFRHVGRLWGLDLTGATDTGYTGDYAQAEGGFDLLSHLGLNEASNPIDWLNHHQDEINQFTLIKRQRGILKSLHASAQQSQVILQVSEDAGANWLDCPVKFNYDGSDFAILLNIPNLMNINHQMIGENIFVDPEASWWNLIKTEKLRFRIYCRVELDQADCSIEQATNVLSQSPRTAVVASQFPVVWVKGDSPWLNYTNVSQFYLLDEQGQAILDTPVGNFQSPAQKKAQRDLDDMSKALMSLNGLPLTDQLTWKLGQCISEIKGRNMKLYSVKSSGNQVNEIALPMIVGMHYQLANPSTPDHTPGIRLDFDDFRQTGGGA